MCSQRDEISRSDRSASAQTLYDFHHLPLLVGASPMIACKGPASIFLLSILCLTCSTPAPSDSGSGFTGTYDATSANGQLFPLLLSSDGGCTTTGLRGTVMPTASGRFMATYTYRRQCGSLTDDVNGAIGGSYTLDGSNIFFAADSGIGKRATHPYLVTATLSGGTITAQSTVSAGVSVTVTFRRR